MDNEFRVDLDDIASAIRTSDVIAVRFVVVVERLLLDFRTTEIDGPLVRVVAPVKSIQERYDSLKQLRPRFAPPEKIVALWWPRFARSLRETGTWNLVLERLGETGHTEAVPMANQTLRQLVELEETQQRAAVAGTGFRTLWSAAPTRP